MKELSYGMEPHGLARNTEGVRRREDLFSVVNREDFTRNMGSSLVLNKEEQLTLSKERTDVLVYRWEWVGNLKACLPNNELTSLSLLKSMWEDNDGEIWKKKKKRGKDWPQRTTRKIQR